MSVADELDKLRATLPGCTLVAFGDLDARIVLCASTSDKRPQEDLDALCHAASGALDGGFAGPVASALGGTHLTEAFAVKPGEIQVFLRSEIEAADALFCSCADQTDIRHMIDSGRKTLSRIAQLA